MMKTATLLLLIPFCLPNGPLAGQGLDPALLTRPATDAWPTYAGDYSQRRYSTLKQVDQTNVRHLTLAWLRRLTAGPGGSEGAWFGPPPGPPAIVGGVAEEPVTMPGATSGSPRLSGSILQVNGILYISSPDNAWAVDALDGHVLWHYWWKSRGGIHIGNRGMAMYGDWLYFETPDDYLVSLDAKTGQERWHKEIADFSQQYFSTTAPMVVGDHVLVGTGDDLDAPGFLQSFDPKTGDLQWKFYTVPMNQGDPGLETWASLDAARHGGAQVWTPGSYDPESHLYIFGTGNPTPAYTAMLRAPRDELESAELRSPDGTLVCRAARDLRDVLPDGQGSAHARGAGRQRAGRRGIARHVHRRDRLQDGQARLEIPAHRRKWHRFAHDGGRSAVRQRRIREPGCLWPAGEAVPGAALACPDRLDRERRGDVHRGRPSICARGRRGGAVCILPAIASSWHNANCLCRSSFCCSPPARTT